MNFSILIGIVVKSGDVYICFQMVDSETRKLVPSNIWNEGKTTTTEWKEKHKSQGHIEDLLKWLHMSFYYLNLVAP